MRQLPAGTVTLLFSDIEGSTALLGRLGERYGAALSAQRALMRAAVSACRGQEVETEERPGHPRRTRPCSRLASRLVLRRGTVTADTGSALAGIFAAG
jgi:class 3 adenylate cyclase